MMIQKAWDYTTKGRNKENSDDDSESDFPSGSRSSQCDGGEIDEEVYDDDEIL